MKFPQKIIPILPGTPLGKWQQDRWFHLERLRQDHQFRIRDATKLGFDFREGAPAQFQSKHRAAGRKQLLCQPLLVTQFPDLRPDDVLRMFSHAPEMELDIKTGGASDCSVFGATCQTGAGQ